MLAFWLGTAFAAGFYHPDDVSQGSALFAKASAASGPAFEERSRKAEMLSRALSDYQEALDLLGSSAPASEVSRLDGLKSKYNVQFAVLDKFANVMMDDFGQEFSAALTRALKARGGATECRALIPEGRPLPGMPTRLKVNPDCKGDDLNAALARDMDADPALQRAVTEIIALKWPDVLLEAAPQSVIGGGDRWISVTTLFKKGARRSLDDIDQQDEEAREPFAAAIEKGASLEEKKKMLAQSAEITAATAKKRASLGAPVLDASRGALARWTKKGEPTTGFCANPSALGGCAGTDASTELVPRLFAEKKVDAALP